MNTTFLEAFEADLATVERVVPVSTDPPGWGSDWSCDDDVRADFEELAANDPLVVAQYCYRGLITDGETGELADDPDWGIDLERELSKGVTARDIDNLRTKIRGQVCRDDRLKNVEVTTDWNVVTETLTITIAADIVDSDGEFLLTIVVDAQGTRLVEVLRNGEPAT
jgi:hypothetical protein